MEDGGQAALVGNGSKVPKSRLKALKNDFYGIIDFRNIDKVSLGNFEFRTWYGNTAYFSRGNNSHPELGINTLVPRKKHTASVATEPSSEFWLETLYICEYCFKYCAEKSSMSSHRLVCPKNTPNPQTGRLVYRDPISKYVIKQVRGYRHQLFCQNLCLFAKLFLDDKSVYYNVDSYEFFIIYGQPDTGSEIDRNMVPMGYFSHELGAWDNDNNLACICVFPPFQNRRLGTLLIDLLYEVPRAQGQSEPTGPEYPLLPFGRATYLRYWAKRLAHILLCSLQRKTLFTLQDLSHLTGFRKEDILLTLEYMQVLGKKVVLQTGEEEGYKPVLLLGNLLQWCEKNKVETSQDMRMLNPDYLLL